MRIKTSKGRKVACLRFCASCACEIFLWKRKLKSLKLSRYPQFTILLSYTETTTFYNPSVLKTIDWENKPIYLRFGILN